MEILIVAKTYMKSAFCIGGFEIETGKNVRLLNSNGENQPLDTDYKIGQIWEIKYSQRNDIVKPHIEDIIIETKNLVKVQENLKDFLMTKADIWIGSPENIFNDKVKFYIGKSGYVSNKYGLPDSSVGFWISDKDLELTIFDDQKHFYYFGDFNEVCVFPYVGTQALVDKIPKGSIIRVSLARWWRPNPQIEEKRCYCQLSGWFN
jgi:hypothetical protein